MHSTWKYTWKKLSARGEYFSVCANKMHDKETLQNKEKGHSRKCKLLSLPTIIYETRNNDQCT